MLIIKNKKIKKIIKQGLKEKTLKTTSSILVTDSFGTYIGRNTKDVENSRYLNLTLSLEKACTVSEFIEKLDTKKTVRLGNKDISFEIDEISIKDARLLIKSTLSNITKESKKSKKKNVKL